MFGWIKKKTPAAEKPKPLGQLGEEFAQKEYETRGFKVIAKNEYNKKGLRRGEIDFIATDKNKIIFVEVKTRKSSGDRFGQGVESVNRFKQIKLISAAKIYLLNNPKYQKLQPQIDVCVIDYNPFDKAFKCAKILMNAVEDWN